MNSHTDVFEWVDESFLENQPLEDDSSWNQFLKELLESL
jgi:hypothetical protein